jgi:hypothetical protein
MANEVQFLFSNHEACEAAYAKSIEYLGTHPDLRSRIDQHTLAYSVLDDLIPQPITRLFSGHDFPVTESFSELRNSLELHFKVSTIMHFPRIDRRSSLECWDFTSQMKPWISRKYRIG